MAVYTSTGNALIMQFLQLDKSAGQGVLALMTVLHTFDTQAGTKTHVGTYHGDEVTLTVYEFDETALMHFADDFPFGGSVHFFARDAAQGNAA
jgi:hypothetical protein